MRGVKAELKGLCIQASGWVQTGTFHKKLISGVQNVFSQEANLFIHCLRLMLDFDHVKQEEGMFLMGKGV